MTSKVVVSIFSLLCVWRRGPASSRPLNARDERRRFGAIAVRIPPTPTCRLTAVRAGVCSLLNTEINRSPIEGETQLGSLTKVVRENPAYYRIDERFRRDRAASPRGFPCEGCALHGHRR